MIRSVRTSLALLAALGVAQTCHAQIVRIGGFGGVSVRAPFVSVDVGPYGPYGVYGGTRVVAPFTSVYSYGPAFPYRRAVVGVPMYPPLPPFGLVPAIPAYPAIAAYRVPVYPVPVPVVEQVVYEEPSIPVEGYQVTRPSLDGHVTEDLRRAAIRLQYSLSLRHDGDVWLDYLGPARIVSAIDQGDTTSSLADLIQNYDGVVANRNLRAVYSASGFNETRELLRVYVDMQPAQAQVSPRAAKPPVAPQPAPPVDAASEENSEDLPAPAPDDANAKRPTPAPPAANPPGAAADEPTEL